jgi:hypothetical protein
MSMRDAKDLHSDISKLLLTLESLHARNTQPKQETVTVELNGGSFKTT